MNNTEDKNEPLDILNYDLSNESDEVKQKIIDGLSNAVGSVFMKTFYSLGLKTHITFTIINESNGDKFTCQFVKIESTQLENQ